MSTAELITIPIDDQRALEVAADTIAIADQDLKSSFIGYIMKVGPALLDARDRLSTGGRGSEFYKWCEESTPYSRRHCNRLIVSFETIKKVEPIGPTLPSSESVCRELSKSEDPLEVWGKVISKTETPIALDVKKEVGVEALSQKEKVLDRIRAEPPATADDLLEISKKYTNRISELRDDGHKIKFVDGVYEWAGQGKPRDKNVSDYEATKKAFAKLKPRSKVKFAAYANQDADVLKIKMRHVEQKQKTVCGTTGKRATSNREDVSFVLSDVMNKLHGIDQKYGPKGKPGWLKKCTEDEVLELLSWCSRIESRLTKVQDFLNTR